MTTLQIQTNPKVKHAVVHLGSVKLTVDDAGNVDGDDYELPTNKDSYSAFWKIDAGHYFGLVRTDGYADTPFEVDMPHDDLITVDLKRAPLQRIGATGGPDLTSGGHRFFAKGVTDFLLFKRFLDGEDITPLLAERSALGANMVRVLGMVASFSHWFPQDYGDAYYDRIAAFCALCESYGLYVYFCVFADTQVVMPGRGQQETHWNRVVDALRACPNTVVEVVNEGDQHDNRIDFDPFEPSGILACRGSLGGDVPPILPAWSLSDFHARRDYPSAVKDMCVLELRGGWSSYPGVGTRAIWHGEPQGFGPNPKRWQDPMRARELAGTARGTAAGVFFHSDCGVLSQPFDDVTKACAAAFFAELSDL